MALLFSSYHPLVSSPVLLLLCLFTSLTSSTASGTVAREVAFQVIDNAPIVDRGVCPDNDVCGTVCCTNGICEPSTQWCQLFPTGPDVESCSAGYGSCPNIPGFCCPTGTFCAASNKTCQSCPADNFLCPDDTSCCPSGNVCQAGGICFDPNYSASSGGASTGAAISSTKSTYEGYGTATTSVSSAKATTTVAGASQTSAASTSSTAKTNGGSASKPNGLESVLACQILLVGVMAAL